MEEAGKGVPSRRNSLCQGSEYTVFKKTKILFSASALLFPGQPVYLRDSWRAGYEAAGRSQGPGSSLALFP